MILPRLYSGNRNASSWTLRAWLALKEAGFDFEEIIVDIRRPRRFHNLQQVARLAPPRAVPVLVCDEGVVFDSLAIMEFANDTCRGALLPRDRMKRARCRAFMAWQHSGLSAICRRISFESAFYPLKRELNAEELGEAERLFRATESELAASGGPFLFGELSLADIILTPTIIRLTSHDLDLGDLPLSRAWASSMLANPHLSAWLKEAAALEPIWSDEYLDAPPEATKWAQPAPDAASSFRPTPDGLHVASP